MRKVKILLLLLMIIATAMLGCSSPRVNVNEEFWESLIGIWEFQGTNGNTRYEWYNSDGMHLYVNIVSVDIENGIIELEYHFCCFIVPIGGVMGNVYSDGIQAFNISDDIRNGRKEILITSFRNNIIGAGCNFTRLSIVEDQGLKLHGMVANVNGNRDGTVWLERGNVDTGRYKTSRHTIENIEAQESERAEVDISTQVPNVEGMGEEAARDPEVVEVEILTFVPELAGFTLADARTMVREQDIRIGLETIGYGFSEIIDEGGIIWQSVGPWNEVPINTTIRIIISVGSSAESSRVPNLEGIGEEAAREALFVAGLEPAAVVRREYSSDVGEGKAIRTSPHFGTEVAVGTVIHLYISLGAE